MTGPGDGNADGQTLTVLADEYTVHRFEPGAAVPEQLHGETFYAVLRSSAELSVCCRSTLPLPSARAESGWRCLMVEGPLDFALTGIVSAITAPLADHGIAVFVISSFDTDYVLIKDDRLQRAVEVLAGQGMQIRFPGNQT
ncbi:MAG: ACT domain-containing protein [Gammaproteobacteria bacterium]|nr:ACT domain-containing protein [Gammaproteobacteria bacterium]